MSLKLIWNDIFDERADALVTPASRKNAVGTGLDFYVHKIAGPGLDHAREKLGRIAPGNVGVTESFGLRRKTGAKYVIHALGPVWNKSNRASVELILDGCYLRILLKALELKCKSIAIPVLSSGKFGMPMGRAVDVAVKAIRDFLAAVDALEVKLVGIDGDFRDYAVANYPELTVEKLTPESSAECRDNYGRREDDPTSTEDAFVLGQENDIFGEQLFARIVGDGKFKGMFQRLWEDTKKRARSGEYGCLPKNRAELADRSGIGATTIKHYCSSEGEAARTTKDRIVALSVAMKLPLEYAERFLATCGHRLGSSKRDKLMRRFIEEGCGKGMYSDINLLFYEVDKKIKPLDLGDAK